MVTSSQASEITLPSLSYGPKCPLPHRKPSETLKRYLFLGLHLYRRKEELQSSRSPASSLIRLEDSRWCRQTRCFLINISRNYPGTTRFQKRDCDVLWIHNWAGTKAAWVLMAIKLPLLASIFSKITASQYHLAQTCSHACLVAGRITT